MEGSARARALEQWAKERGYQVGWGGQEVAGAALADIMARRDSGEIEGAFYRRRLSGLVEGPGAGPASRRPGGPGLGRSGWTIVVLVVPQPAYEFCFELPDRLRRDHPSGQLRAIVPPTYSWNPEVAVRLRAGLEKGPLSGAGFTVARFQGPLKNVAARLGLVDYGRNNLTYTRETGSYHLLAGYVTDAPFEPRGAVAAPRMGESCKTCTACLRACPTGAIGEDRFLLHAERCLAYPNEYADPWPDWVTPAAHNSLVGCLSCQRACPRNRGRLKVVPVEPAFSAEETATILEDRGLTSPKGRAIARRFASIGLAGYDGALGRNLEALLWKDDRL